MIPIWDHYTGIIWACMIENVTTEEKGVFFLGFSSLIVSCRMASDHSEGIGGAFFLYFMEKVTSLFFFRNVFLMVVE